MVNSFAGRVGHVDKHAFRFDRFDQLKQLEGRQKQSGTR